MQPSCLFDPRRPPYLSTTNLDPPLGSAERLAMTAIVPELWIDGHNKLRPPQSGPADEWTLTYAGVVMHFMDENFDVHIVGNDPPGEGPAAWSGDCLYDFISSTWCEGNGVLVDTTSPVPVRYVTDVRCPDGLPDHPGVEITVIGSTNLNYREFDLDPESFWEASPPPGAAV